MRDESPLPAPVQRCGCRSGAGSIPAVAPVGSPAASRRRHPHQSSFRTGKRQRGAAARNRSHSLWRSCAAGKPITACVQGPSTADFRIDRHAKWETSPLPRRFPPDDIAPVGDGRGAEHEGSSAPAASPSAMRGNGVGGVSCAAFQDQRSPSGASRISRAMVLIENEGSVRADGWRRGQPHGQERRDANRRSHRRFRGCVHRHSGPHRDHLYGCDHLAGGDHGIGCERRDRHGFIDQVTASIPADSGRETEHSA